VNLELKVNKLVANILGYKLKLQILKLIDTSIVRNVTAYSWWIRKSDKGWRCGGVLA
jgi:hypothetical protein